jgi:hypothetical protein
MNSALFRIVSYTADAEVRGLWHTDGTRRCCYVAPVPSRFTAPPESCSSLRSRGRAHFGEQALDLAEEPCAFHLADTGLERE